MNYSIIFTEISFSPETSILLQIIQIIHMTVVPRKVEGCARSGHVTGQRSLRGRGSRKGLQRAPTNTMLFSDYHLAKLNPNCHMNYLDYL